jgi:hypothetical protein
VIDEQASVELAARRPRDAKGVEALTGRGAGDRDGVDRVGLAALASRPTTRPTARPAPTRFDAKSSGHGLFSIRRTSGNAAPP